MSTTTHLQRARFTVVGTLMLCVISFNAPSVHAKGEPAEDFLARLRAGKYFDIAIAYLDRLDQFPGVDPELKNAIELEKAQTLIDAAIASRNATNRDKFLVSALGSLQSFLKNGNHPRASEARIRLGGLQRFRASQLLSGEPDEDKKKQARESFLASSKTFDGIIADLKTKLTAMKGQKIDASKEPEKASRREQYKYEYLEAQVNAAETKILAAKTHNNPSKDGKALLEDAVTRFTSIQEKYSDYPRGAQSMLFLGQAQELLGDKAKAIMYYKEMVDQIEAEELRDTKYAAAAGLIGMYMKETPPKFQSGIDIAKSLIKGVRPNEKALPNVQALRLTLAKAYLAKSEDKKNQKPTDLKRALSEGRSLLNDAKRIPGPHLKEVTELLKGLGIGDNEDGPKLPTAEPPKSFQAAMDSAREVLAATTNLKQALQALKEQEQTPEIKAQVESVEKQLTESRYVGIQILRGGLGMINRNTDNESVNQARQYLAYMLFNQGNYRGSSVVGSFLARSSPGTDIGLSGGTMALKSLKRVIGEVPEDENEGLLSQLQEFGDYLSKTWPDDPIAAEAQGTRISLMLKKDDYDGAKATIDSLKSGADQARFRRLLGQLLWNRAVTLENDGQDEKATAVLADAENSLKTGMDALTGIVPKQDMQAAVILMKVYLKRGKPAEAMKVLKHPKYSPIKQLEVQGAPSESFKGSLYSTEIKVLFANMLLVKDTAPLLDRATEVMEALPKAYPGPDGQRRLTLIYMGLAKDIGGQLKQAPPDQKTTLIQAFQVLLDRIASTSKDKGTLKWVGQTQMEMGQSLMLPTDIKANGQAQQLISSAAKTFDGLGGQDQTIAYLSAQANRIAGNYERCINTLEKILKQNPNNLDAQIEGALAYEYWAGDFKAANVAAKVYEAALMGGRPNAKRVNTIWGWGKISRLISGKQQFREKFFDARYHVASCRLAWGVKLNNKKIIEKSVTDITGLEAQFPDLGGAKQHAKFNALLKTCQRTAGQPQNGLKPFVQKPPPAKDN